MDKNSSKIIIDNGAGSIKVGFHSDYLPTVEIENIVGYPKQTSGLNTNEYFIGQKIEENIENLTLKYPIQDYYINWNEMETIWNHIFFNELKVKTSEFKIFCTEKPLNSKMNREKITQIMFENNEVGGFYIACTSNCSLYSTGKTTGIVYDSGEGSTYFTPIYDGYALPHAILRCSTAGRTLTDYFIKLLTNKLFSKNYFTQRKLIKEIKERACCVAMDYGKEIEEAKDKSNEISYNLPDGDIVKIGYERFKCPEALFRPTFIGKSYSGIHEDLFQAIMKTDIDIRADMYKNIVLSGGSSLFLKLSERLTSELIKLAPTSLGSSIKITANDDRKYSTWNGAISILSLSASDQMFITKEEYDENGPSIVHRKFCF